MILPVHPSVEVPYPNFPMIQTLEDPFLFQQATMSVRLSRKNYLLNKDRSLDYYLSPLAYF